MVRKKYYIPILIKNKLFLSILPIKILEKGIVMNCLGVYDSLRLTVWDIVLKQSGKLVFNYENFRKVQIKMCWIIHKFRKPHFTGRSAEKLWKFRSE